MNEYGEFTDDQCLKALHDDLCHDQCLIRWYLEPPFSQSPYQVAAVQQMLLDHIIRLRIDGEDNRTELRARAHERINA